MLFLVTRDGLWKFANAELAIQNGWTYEQVRVVDARDIVALPQRGVILEANLKKFSPQAVLGVR